MEVFSHASLKRAKTAVAKRGLAVRRKPRFIQQDVLAGMVLQSIDKPECRHFVMLCLISYVFLLRVPSECLPVAFHDAHGEVDCTVLRLRGQVLEMWFPRRKNRNEPTVQARSCWCKQCLVTCPVHVVGGYLQEFESGARPFLQWRPDMVLKELRARLEICSPRFEARSC